MKKKKLLKRIEELERRNTQLENQYEKLLYIDDRETILFMRVLHEQNKKHEQLLLKGLSSGVNTFTPITNPIYHPDPILFNKYCKECKYPILRLDKLATVLKNGQRVFRYDKKNN